MKLFEKIIQHPGEPRQSDSTTETKSQDYNDIVRQKRIFQSGCNEFIFTKYQQNECTADSRQNHGTDGHDSTKENKPRCYMFLVEREKPESADFQFHQIETPFHFTRSEKEKKYEI